MCPASPAYANDARLWIVQYPAAPIQFAILLLIL